MYFCKGFFHYLYQNCIVCTLLLFQPPQKNPRKSTYSVNWLRTPFLMAMYHFMLVNNFMLVNVQQLTLSGKTLVGSVCGYLCTKYPHPSSSQTWVTCWWDKMGLGRCVCAVSEADSSKLLEKVPQWIQFLSTDDEHNLLPGSPTLHYQQWLINPNL